MNDKEPAQLKYWVIIIVAFGIAIVVPLVGFWSTGRFPQVFGDRNMIDLLIIAAAGTAGVITILLLYVRSKAADDTSKLAVQAQSHIAYMDALKLLADPNDAARAVGIQLLVRLANTQPIKYMEEVASALLNYSSVMCKGILDPIRNAIDQQHENSVMTQEADEELGSAWETTPGIVAVTVKATMNMLAQEFARKALDFEIPRMSGILLAKSILRDAHPVGMKLHHWYFDRAYIRECSFTDVEIIGYVRQTSFVSFENCKLENCKIFLINANIKKLSESVAFLRFKGCEIGEGVYVGTSQLEPGSNFSGEIQIR